MDIDNLTLILPYFVAMLVIWAIYAWLRNQQTQQNLSHLNEATTAGLTEPASLHPFVDLADCIGCGSCVEACPEKNVLGLIQGKATLINPTACIGHGACRLACPTESITLVFGTEKRGVDIPLVNANFETNVPGVFIAGELGGMGLIRNAITQGSQAVDEIRKLNMSPDCDILDLIIIGAGPAGIAAALAAKQYKLTYKVLEQDSLGGTVAHYPRGKLVMTAPAKLPIIGEMTFTETTKENLMAYWEKITQEQQLNINYHERVESAKRVADKFTITTPNNTYQSHSLLLAIGRRGSPRKLGVPGEDLDKVVYRLIDTQQYNGQHVLLVGGGDSALEAACSLAEESDAVVTLSYRSDSFSRAKVKNRNRVTLNEKRGLLNVLLSSNVLEVKKKTVSIKYQDDTLTIENDTVIVCAGGILPTAFLQRIGINVETKFGTA